MTPTIPEIAKKQELPLQAELTKLKENVEKASLTNMGKGGPQLVSMGRIVFYNHNGRHVVALVTSINQDSSVNLRTFDDESDCAEVQRNVSEGEGHCKWIWPPRV